MKKINSVFFLLFLLVSVSYGQGSRSLFPDGFHLGITGEMNLAQKMTVVPLTTGCPAPITFPTLGWKSGFEFSYHFAKYYGVSIGFDLGTMSQFRLFYWLDNTYIPCGHTTGRLAFPKWQVPIKFEFHYPIKQSEFFFYGAVGVNLVDIREGLLNLFQRIDYSYTIRYEWPETDPFMCYLEDADGGKLNVDLQLNLGFYYRLPYNDLIRFSILANYAFKDKFQGYYRYLYDKESYGTLNYRHNHIGFELAYVHCFEKRTKKSK